MAALLLAAVQVALLAVLLQWALRKFEPGRTFAARRVWIAAGVVTALYAVPAIADYLYHWKAAVYPKLTFLRTTWGSLAWQLAAFSILFGVQWLVYRVYLRDTSGGPLTRRGNLWIAAVPTLVGLVVVAGGVLVLGVVFYLIGGR